MKIVIFSKTKSKIQNFSGIKCDLFSILHNMLCNYCRIMIFSLQLSWTFPCTRAKSSPCTCFLRSTRSSATPCTSVGWPRIITWTTMTGLGTDWSLTEENNFFVFVLFEIFFCFVWNKKIIFLFCFWGTLFSRKLYLKNLWPAVLVWFEAIKFNYTTQISTKFWGF